ncbi:MAG: hypothetical protein ACE37N_03475 [Pseudohongiellaceae bacterium]
MKANKTISRITTDSEPQGFAWLRKEGIEISQELSGLGWTDYNYHDPGVTILEQVCFALTDLIYRTSFDVADYLCDERGEIDTTALGLHAPQDVLFNRPATALDFQKLLVDCSTDIADVKVRCDPVVGDGYGLVEIEVRGQVGNGGVYPDMEALRGQTRENFHRVRNLCEDLEGPVAVVTEIECQLQAEISIRPGFSAAKVLAEIYFHAAEQLARKINYQPFSGGVESAQSLDELLQGPRTRQGLIPDSVFDSEHNVRDLHLLESAILSQVRDIDGVDYIADLRLSASTDEFLERDARRAYAFHLRVPDDGGGMEHIRVLSAGRSLTYSRDEFLAQLEAMRFSSSSKTYRLEDDIRLSLKPRGTYRDLARYQSVQNHFPNAYGINQFGVPDTYSPERKAQALQLKTYLLLFEQIMANYLANLGSIRQLFSIDGQDRLSYFAGVLQAEEISSLERVYPDNAAEILNTILSRLDDFIGRKSRLLDYLLGLYGEEFSQEQLRNLDCYHSQAELDRLVIFNKVRLLNRIKFASGDRGAAINLTRPTDFGADPADPESGIDSLECVSGLQYRVSIFLGFRHLLPRSMVSEVFRYGLTIEDRPDVDNAQQDGLVRSARERSEASMDEADARYYRVVRATLGGFDGLRNGVLPAPVLQSGIRESSYRTRDGSLFLELDKEPGSDGVDARQLELLRNRSGDEIARNRKFLQRCLLHLNQECEGMHVLEHILLRPANFRDKAHEFKAKYANRVSVIFPAWTARCQDRQFRSLAEESVRKNCPAHIATEVYWLGFADMCRFEVLHRNWLDLLTVRDDPDKRADIDAASIKLQRFLELERSRQGTFNKFGQGFAILKKRIDDKLSHFLKLLYHRRRELEYSSRRDDDAELDYLRGLELLEIELKQFRILSVQHMTLMAEGDRQDPDWEFYVARISIILPKLRAFRKGSELHRHFHKIQILVENTVREAADTRWALNFHWLTPDDMKNFRSVYGRWHQAEERSGNDEAELLACRRDLTATLRILEESSAVTGDTHAWKKVLGAIQ